MLRKILLFSLYCCMAWTLSGGVTAQAQNVAVKNNLLYDLIATPNLGIEIGLGRKVTAQVFYGLNPWKNSQGEMMRHWQVMPEVRYWTCQKFNGHFFGLHVMGGEFKFSQVDAPFGFFPNFKDNLYTGWNAGIGLTYGYQWILHKHWNLEASVGLGYDYIRYKKYDCVDCGTLRDDSHLNYFGPTKLALSLIYLF